MSFWNFYNLCGRYFHALFQPPGIQHLSIDTELLALWNLELLILAVFQGQNDTGWGIDVPHFSADGLNRGDHLRSCRSSDGSFELHAGLEVVNAHRGAIDGNSRGLRY